MREYSAKQIKQLQSSLCFCALWVSSSRDVENTAVFFVVCILWMFVQHGDCGGVIYHQTRV